MSKAIMFQFDDRRSAYLALDTLDELGYRAHLGGSDERPEVHVEVDHNDLTSALEIVQAHGGNLREEATTGATHDTFAEAYDLDAVPIPAHVVNEDWPESYREPGREAAPTGDGAVDDAEIVDPSAETYDHFSADVRL